MALVEVGDQAELRWPPAEQLLGARARRRVVDGDEAREPAELRRSLSRWNALRRDAEVAPDRLGDLPERNPLVADGVQP